ncbi:MAG: calcium/sodium antiporter [Planctomycetes bacterium]|nr:calcium/sodium antiporter [Planctomycetota bacterium]
MEILSSFLTFSFGLFLLIFASGWLIQGSVKLAYILKLTPLFIGLVLVAFGTSAPEAGVGITAVIRNQKSIAFGNVVGSNRANIGLIIGLCAIIKPLEVVDKSIFKRELPIMLLSAILLYVLSWDLCISRVDGLIFSSFFIIFFFISYRGSKKSFNPEEAQNFRFKKCLDKSIHPFFVWVIILLSLAGIILGADLMVQGGVSLAKIFGVSTWVIGVFIFAVGTSLPELVASLTAVFKKVPSIGLGNIVGSNIFNILFVLGIVSLIKPIHLQSSRLKFELPVMIVFSFLLLLVMRIGYKITRVAGIVLFLGYIGFIFFVLNISA